MAIKIEFEGRGGEFSKLHINQNGRDLIYTGKTANMLMDAMDQWADTQHLRPDHRQLTLTLAEANNAKKGLKK